MFVMGTANLPTNIVDFGGFDSSIMLCLRGGILMSMGNFPESLSQAMLGVMLAGRLGVVILVSCQGIPLSIGINVRTPVAAERVFGVFANLRSAQGVFGVAFGVFGMNTNSSTIITIYYY